jgi:hypothetical protein
MAFFDVGDAKKTSYTEGSPFSHSTTFFSIRNKNFDFWGQPNKSLYLVFLIF